MNLNFRDDERKKTKALLEQRALDKVLNMMKNVGGKSEMPIQKKFEKFVYRQKSALNKNILEDRNKWMAKHKMVSKDSIYYYDWN
jgi:hypothetical protein